MVHYVDTSALVKLVVAEAETSSLATFETAGHLDPTILRTLDALHLAAALELGDDLAGIVTYDDRMADAARSHGITVVAPS